MGYFTSLARQSGMAPIAAARPVRNLEVDVTRIAEPPQVSAPSPPDLRASARPAPLSRERVVEIPAAPSFEVHEHVVDLMAPALPQEATESSPALPFAAAVRVAEPEPKPRACPPESGQPQPGERRRPTLADVRSWVAQPLPPMAQPSAAEPSPLRTHAPVRALDAPTPAFDRAENYTLEIGTIQIVVDQPATPQPQRTAPQAPSSAPGAGAWSDPSRYYLRH